MARRAQISKEPFSDDVERGGESVTVLMAERMQLDNRLLAQVESSNDIHA
jgi:hypothetical protein